MKPLLLTLALLCVGCAATDEVAKEDVYHPPVYRTGSNIPVQGGRTESAGSTIDGGDAVRQQQLPTGMPRPTSR